MNTRNLVRLSAAIVCVLTLGAGAAQASIQVTGANLNSYRSTANDTVTATGMWDGNGMGDSGFKIVWKIYQRADSWWSYTYTLSNEMGGNLSKDISHWILQISQTDNLDNYRCFSSSPDSGDPTTYSSSLHGNSDATMPNSIFGLKFTPNNSQDQKFTVSFQSLNAPVWGNFYAIDGHNQPITSAWNDGLTTASMPSVGTTNFIPWIAVPDGDRSPTGPQDTQSLPEPGAVIVWLLGGLGFAATVARRRQRRLAAANA